MPVKHYNLDYSIDDGTTWLPAVGHQDETPGSGKELLISGLTPATYSIKLKAIPLNAGVSDPTGAVISSAVILNLGTAPITEAVFSAAESNVTISDVMTLRDSLLAAIGVDVSASNAQSMVDAPQVDVTVVPTVIDSKLTGIQEPVHTDITALATITDIRTMLENVIAVATSAASVNTGPLKPTGLTAGTYLSDGTGFTLSWSASSDPESQAITYDVFKNGVSTYTGISATSKAVTGQTAGSTATWTVRAVDASSLASSQSAGLSVTTTAAVSYNVSTFETGMDGWTFTADSNGGGGTDATGARTTALHDGTGSYSFAVTSGVYDDYVDTSGSSGNISKTLTLTPGTVSFRYYTPRTTDWLSVVVDGVVVYDNGVVTTANAWTTVSFNNTATGSKTVLIHMSGTASGDVVAVDNISLPV